jgi:hypothetical protein
MEVDDLGQQNYKGYLSKLNPAAGGAPVGVAPRPSVSVMAPTSHAPTVMTTHAHTAHGVFPYHHSAGGQAALAAPTHLPIPVTHGALGQLYNYKSAKEEERKRQKRALNRQSAQRCRKRKRAMLDDLVKANKIFSTHAAILKSLPSTNVEFQYRVGTITYAHGTEEQLGYEPGELEGRSVYDLLEGSSRLRVKQLISQLIYDWENTTNESGSASSHDSASNSNGSDNDMDNGCMTPGESNGVSSSGGGGTSAEGSESSGSGIESSGSGNENSGDNGSSNGDSNSVEGQEAEGEGPWSDEGNADSGGEAGANSGSGSGGSGNPSPNRVRAPATRAPSASSVSASSSWNGSARGNSGSPTAGPVELAKKGASGASASASADRGTETPPAQPSSASSSSSSSSPPGPAPAKGSEAPAPARVANGHATKGDAAATQAGMVVLASSNGVGTDRTSSTDGSTLNRFTSCEPGSSTNSNISQMLTFGHPASNEFTYQITVRRPT